MIDVPVSWVSYRDYNPAKGRWDQLWLQRMLEGEEGHPPCGYRFVETPWTPEDGRGRVVVFPAGSYGEHDEAPLILGRLMAHLNQLEWAVVFATSDECQLTPWHLYADSWPHHVKLWVQLARPEKTYPPGTRFFGEGSPAGAKQIAVHAQPDWAKDIDVFFSGQMGHERRVAMWEALGPLRDRDDIDVIAQATDGFLQGMNPDDYFAHMTRAWIVPCPSGICSQSSFRLFEALESQAIPIADELRPGSGKLGFWQMLGLDGCGLAISDWSSLPDIVDTVFDIGGGDETLGRQTSNFVQSNWQQYKRRTLANIHNDVADARVTMFNIPDGPDDTITVIIPTSPVPSNPSLDIIQETIASVRERLPLAEILITCDGVREEQAERAGGYHEFVRRLLAWTNSQTNITPWVMRKHVHQSGMMREILPEVVTPYLLYVEHDCPLVGEIPFDVIISTMIHRELAVMRFYHDVAITEGSEHLMLEHRGPKWDQPSSGVVGYLPTIQWSQRPHLAHAAFYRNMIATYFGPDARTMIEDVMHGVVQADAPADPTYPGGIRAAEAWKRWRLAIYAPEGSIKRSTHLDARGDDPKYPMLFAYPGHQRPEGAPPEGFSE